MRPLRVILFRDPEASCWVAQGLEVDLNAQGRTEQAAVDALKATMALREELDRSAKREPFSRTRPADEKYFEMLKHGEPWVPSQKTASSDGPAFSVILSAH